MPIDPRRTWALVVGIERYAAGDKWVLDGPANDARRFADGLLGRGVPPRNVVLCLSSLPGKEALREGPISVRGAKQADITEEFYRLLKEDGDLFILFWGGHGVTAAQRKSRRLFLADTDEDNWRILEVESLLEAMGSRSCPASPSKS